MKGPEPIKPPDFFTLEWYKLQKEQGKTDTELAAELFISYMTFHKWKKQIGWKSGDGRKYAGRKPLSIADQIVEMKNQGHSNPRIARNLSISTKTVCKYLKEVGC